MARLAAQEKGEYYPTPLEIAEAVAGFLHVKTSRNKPVLRLFDPCCGEGLALARIAEVVAPRVPDDLVVETWGVEINPRRAAEAASRLDHVVVSPFEVTHWKPSRWGVASMLFLNPPYDHSQTRRFSRMETYFLERATPALEPGGLLVYIVPPAALDWQGVVSLYQLYEDVAVYRFPDELFERFKQLIIVGTRRPARISRYHYPPNDGILNQVSDMRRDAERLRRHLVPLAHRPDPLVVPTTRTKATLHRGAWTVAEVRATVEADRAAPLVEALTGLYGPSREITLEPLVPPKQGHIAQVLASGVMSTMAFPGEVLKGRAVKSREFAGETESVNAKGELVTEKRFKDQLSNHIVRVTPDGLEYLSESGKVIQFLKANVDRLAEKLKDRLRPYGNSITPEEEAILARLSPDRYLPGRDEAGLLDDQKETAIAMARSIRRHGVGHLVAMMGYGKTTTALGTLEVLGDYPALVICPPHLVDKWAREAVDVVPGAKPAIVENITELEAVRREHQPGDRTLVIMSRSRIKLGPGWHAATNTIHSLPEGEEHRKARQRVAAAVEAYKEARTAYLQAVRDPSTAPEVLEDLREQARKRRKEALGKALPVVTCPSCGQPVVDGRRIKRAEQLDKRPYTCPNTIEVWDAAEEDVRKVHCDAPLWQSDEDGYRRWPLADYIAKKMPGFFRLLIADEVHQYKAKDSDQGWAFGLLAQTIPGVLTLTGTFFGGPSTSIFWLLYRTQANVRRDFSFHDERRWVEQFGVEEEIVRETANGVSHYRGRRRTSVRTRERPGISPAIVRYILPTTVFRSLSDLGLDLPPFHDEVVTLEMDEAQARDYQDVYKSTWAAMVKFGPRFTASWLQWTLARPNSCFREETIEFPDGETKGVDPVVDASTGEVLPKEEWLVSTVKAELTRGRRCLIYLRQTGTRDIRSRLVQVLAEAGIEAQILQQSVPPRKREAWLKKHNPRVLITNPKLIETGLDLVQYATAIFYEPDYSLYTVWQACRRVWRLGQTKPVKVYYPVYNGFPGTPVMEDLCLRLIGQKMAAAQLLYGNDVAGAIVPDMDDNLVVQLVNAIKSGKAAEMERVDSLFGFDDRTTGSPVGSPTRMSRPLLSWEEWLRRKGVTKADVRPRRRRRTSSPPPGQLALGLGV